ncbi:MAG: hypothetical protein A2381_17060 [Bdellovibrionales bacterium RIFOXYB1_FULL_37_110]|nr:MAG: hypothetical protein A2181_08065 [Bdellovibrionales bacterium RIFOXYA1_FULL_38_20]OFZ50107.1 MAG: hypothetical protein A2417_18895 [Bdellovibrionales bacterium RIFOXYC1_FULL_37_79]OFZ60013.1 MAG: hypothetical protein A2381_17060 [Bdellovibrionales bacterium RIFOXYB1_FULL_37_110]OFZ64264.1 MAG: hypothetical protein A2577_12595 [Bdellovibrionales bacterium RIFOXYD1_FULL_36_51]
MNIQPIKITDKAKLVNLLEDISLFTPDERAVALELLEDTSPSSDYHFLGTFEDNGELSSFICFGPTPMTHGTFDMYWVGTADHHQRKGLARKLFNEMNMVLKKQNARMVRIETSGKDNYVSTRSFYENIRLVEEARLKDFYSVGDDLIIYMFRF